MPAHEVGLVLSGGGARAAYQVGVLRAIARMLPERTRNPFAVICGTSAGAINATGLASDAGRFDRAVSRLTRTWGNLRSGQVYRADLRAAILCVLQAFAALVSVRGDRPTSLSLLDCTPLADLLSRTIDFTQIRHAIAAGHLRALCVTASSYASGHSISFFQGGGSHESWRRARRVGRRTEIRLPHVLASCALPFAFPVVQIENEYFGDGSMHQLAPISPALHLGAERVLVIGVGSESLEDQEVRDPIPRPSLAQLAGHMLDAIFVDTLDMDLERLERVNHTLASINHEVGDSGLRTIQTLVIRPSEPIARIAAAHANELPRMMRLLMRRAGALEPNGARVLSYLMFERGYCRHLMRLGFSDAIGQRDRILKFLGHLPQEMESRPDPQAAPLREAEIFARQ